MYIFYQLKSSNVLYYNVLYVCVSVGMVCSIVSSAAVLRTPVSNPLVARLFCLLRWYWLSGHCVNLYTRIALLTLLKSLSLHIHDSFCRLLFSHPQGGGSETGSENNEMSLLQSSCFTKTAFKGDLWHCFIMIGYIFTVIQCTTWHVT